jgi:hypothetical protein
MTIPMTDFGKCELSPNYNYVKFYNPSEHLAIHEVTVPFKGRVTFKQYISKKHKSFGIKI